MISNTVLIDLTAKASNNLYISEEYFRQKKTSGSVLDDSRSVLGSVLPQRLLARNMEDPNNLVKY